VCVDDVVEVSRQALEFRVDITLQRIGDIDLMTRQVDLHVVTPRGSNSLLIQALALV
jgi:hypothetical protein